jgi:hypothetical protein
MQGVGVWGDGRGGGGVEELTSFLKEEVPLWFVGLTEAFYTPRHCKWTR